MDRSLLSTRATLVLLLAVLAGAAVGLLSAFAGEGPARCVLCGFAAAGGALPVANQVIAPDAAGREPGALRTSGDDRG